MLPAFLIIIGVLFSGTILGCANTNEAPDQIAQNSQCQSTQAAVLGAAADRVWQKRRMLWQVVFRVDAAQNQQMIVLNRDVTGQICQDDYYRSP